MFHWATSTVRRLCGLDSGDAVVLLRRLRQRLRHLLESGVLASGQNFRETELFRQSLRLGLISNRTEGRARCLSPLAIAETREAVYPSPACGAPPAAG